MYGVANVRYLQQAWSSSDRGEATIDKDLLPLVITKSPQQDNGFDCGVYVLRNAKASLYHYLRAANCLGWCTSSWLVWLGEGGRLDDWLAIVIAHQDLLTNDPGSAALTTVPSSTVEEVGVLSLLSLICMAAISFSFTFVSTVAEASIRPCLHPLSRCVEPHVSRQEILQEWPIVTQADVDDGMRNHFTPELFSRSDILKERRIIRELLQTYK